MSREPVRRPEIVVDLRAIRRNVGILRDLVAPDGSDVMVVVKADGYGHGMLPSARAALAGGATWLGTATLEEALTLRAAGIEAPVLAWLWTVGEYDGLRDAVAAGVDISVNSVRQLRMVGDAARQTGTTAHVQLKADTGLSRNGAYDAASVGSWVHGAAAALARPDGPVSAAEVARAVPELCARLVRESR